MTFALFVVEVEDLVGELMEGNRRHDLGQPIYFNATIHEHIITSSFAKYGQNLELCSDSPMNQYLSISKVRMHARSHPFRRHTPLAQYARYIIHDHFPVIFHRR
jgi:hypothetical protein